MFFFYEICIDTDIHMSCRCIDFVLKNDDYHEKICCEIRMMFEIC